QHLILSSRIRRTSMSTLFPYTTLFRSQAAHRRAAADHKRVPGQNEPGGTTSGAPGVRERTGQDHSILPGAPYCETRDHRVGAAEDRKSTRLNSSHVKISYAVFCLKKKK